MTAIIREDLALRIRADALVALRRIALAEGMTEQSLIDEALDDLIGKHALSTAGAHVIAAYQEGARVYAALYRALAR
jgi:hypothetical protein